MDETGRNPPFRLVAAAWESGLIAGLTEEFMHFDPEAYVRGDLAATNDASRGRGDVVGPEYSVRLRMVGVPVAMEIALQDLPGPAIDPTKFGSVFVVPLADEELVELASVLRLTLGRDVIEAWDNDDDPESVFARAQKVARTNGVDLVLTKTLGGATTMTVTRRLDQKQLNYSVSAQDPESYRTSNRQLRNFRDAIHAIAAALEPTTPAPKAGCYIATAVYGSYDADEVVTLRRFRDERLAPHLLGRVFITSYYWISPALAKWFAGATRMNRQARRVLDRIVRAIERA